MMEENIQANWLPKNVDQFLQDKCKFSLYHFMVSLDDIFSEYDHRIMKVPVGTTGHPTSWREFWHDNIQVLNKLKAYNRNSKDILKKFHNETRKYLDPLISHYPHPEDSHLVIDDLSKTIEEYKKNITNHLLDSKAKRGGVEKKKNVLFLTWSHFIKGKNKSGVNFERIINLMDWFSLRTKLHDLKETRNSEQNFRRVLSRHRKKKNKDPLVSMIDDYKERFLVPIQHSWLEQGIAGFEPDEPLIIFSNAEILTAKDCVINNPSLDIEIELGTVLTYDFRDSKKDEFPIFMSEYRDGKGETSIHIDQSLVDQDIPDDPDS